MLMAMRRGARRLVKERCFAAGSSHCLPGLLQIQFIAHFDDPVEAAKAYDVAVLEWRGERAVTNFPADDYFEAGLRSMDAEDLPESSSTLPAARAQSAQPAKSAGRPAQAEKPTVQPVQKRASDGAAASRASDAAPATADFAAQDAGATAQRSSSGAPDGQADMSEAQPDAGEKAAILPAEVCTHRLELLPGE